MFSWFQEIPNCAGPGKLCREPQPACQSPRTHFWLSRSLTQQGQGATFPTLGLRCLLWSLVTSAQTVLRRKCGNRREEL